MRNIRIITRLDVKTDNLVKGVKLEGLRKLGPPNRFSTKYYEQGVDEIIYMDIVASLYERNSLSSIIRQASQDIFIPLTVGGGIRSIEGAKVALHSGADKIAINTAIIKNPDLICAVADQFGSQCMVASVEAQSLQSGGWEAYYDNGREKTGIDVIDWVQEIEDRGAGEILLTSVDKEGTGYGMDIELVSKVCEAVEIPVIASGGVGSVKDIVEVVQNTTVSAVAIAKILHYEETSIFCIKDQLKKLQGIEVR